MIDDIKDKYVICTFGVDSHKLVKVKSETKSKFTFAIDYDRRQGETDYTQMKNTIIAIGTRDELVQYFDLIKKHEKIMSDARSERLKVLKALREKFKE